MLQRVYVHFLVDCIPAAGLIETVETLHSIAEFYQPRAQRSLPPPLKSVPVDVVGRVQRQIVPMPVE
jgi:hypothetical protein